MRDEGHPWSPMLESYGDFSRDLLQFLWIFIGAFGGKTKTEDAAGRCVECLKFFDMTHVGILLIVMEHVVSVDHELIETTQFWLNKSGSWSKGIWDTPHFQTY